MVEQQQRVLHAGGGGAKERRGPGDGPGVDVGPDLEQQSGDGRTHRQHRRDVQRRAAVDRPGIDRRAVHQQQLRLGPIGHGPVQRGRHPPVARLHVRARVQERFHDLQRARVGAVHQRRRPGRIRGSGQRSVGRERAANRGQVVRSNDIEENLNARIGPPLRDHGLGGTTRHVGTRIDPGAQHANFFGRQRARRRHLQSGVGSDQTLNQFALGRAARHDDNAVVASAEGVLSQVEPQTRLLLQRSVAAEASIGENRPDLLLVIDRRQVLRAGRRLRAG